jgi:O-antigen ligase
MGITHIWSGVGFDTYGDWFRTLRRSSALVRPGIDTVSNSAHNVFLDIFAFGGLPLVTAYVVILVFVLLSIMRFTKRHKHFDFYFVALVSAWSCFQLQSVISINQVGLAIWGWLLSGAIIAYERITAEHDPNSLEVTSREKLKKGTNSEIISFGLRAGVGFVIGLLIAVPPLSADMKWRSAQMSGNAVQVESVLKSSYMNPLNSYKFLEIVGAFEQSNLPETARKLALEAVDFNPHNYESWRLFTLISGVSQQEMQTALSKMHELDPLNPNIVEAN